MVFASIVSFSFILSVLFSAKRREEGQYFCSIIEHRHPCRKSEFILEFFERWWKIAVELSSSAIFILILSLVTFLYIYKISQ